MDHDLSAAEERVRQVETASGRKVWVDSDGRLRLTKGARYAQAAEDAYTDEEWLAMLGDDDEAVRRFIEARAEAEIAVADARAEVLHRERAESGAAQPPSASDVLNRPPYRWDPSVDGEPFGLPPVDEGEDS